MLSQACQRCWHRKQKCDRLSPECSTCVAAGVKCVPRVWGRVLNSDGQHDTSGDNTPFNSSQSQSQMRSPIEYMKWRINYLENSTSGESGEDTVVEVSPGNHTSTTPCAQIQIQPGNRRRSTLRTVSGIDTGITGVASEGVADVTSNEVEYLSLTAMSAGAKNDQNQGQVSILSHVLARIVSVRGTDPGSGSVPASQMASTATNAGSKTSLHDIEKEIKSLTGKDHRYLAGIAARVNAWSCPFMSQAECDNLLDSISDESHGALNQSQPEPGIEMVASSILALGVTSSPFQNVLRGPLMELIDRSQQVLPEILATGSDVKSIQCLISQTVLSLYHPTAGSAWQLLGLALTKAIAAGLHRSSSTVIETIEEDTPSEMLFWTLYLLDRTLAVCMGRPFGLEDGDIALKMPEISMPTVVADTATISKAVFVWKLNHAFLMSQWRQSSTFDLDSSFASYEYWKDSYHEICQRLINAEKKEFGDENARFWGALILKDHAQLSCRALIHLLDQATSKLHFTDASLVRLKRYIVTELPHLIEVMQDSIDHNPVAPTFLDGYDVFSAVVMYVFCVHDPQQPSSFRLSITQLKTATASIDVIQVVAQHFRPLRHFKDIVWSLLHALEAQAEHRDPGQLENHFTNCEISIPKHIKRVIDMCTHRQT